jgi:hypothetical protein
MECMADQLLVEPAFRALLRAVVGSLASGVSDELPSFLSLLERMPPYLACEALCELRSVSEEFDGLYHFLEGLLRGKGCVCKSLFRCLPVFGAGNHAMEVVAQVIGQGIANCDREISESALVCAFEPVSQIGGLQEQVME